MTRLAIASLRFRGVSLTACAISIFLGTAILLGFGSMLDTGLADGVSSRDRDALVTMASVVGGWGLVIVLFSVASTLGLTVRRRGPELAALRTIGMSNRQVRTLVRRETLAVSVVSAGAAVLPGFVLGRVLVALFHHGNVIAPGVRYRFGPVTSSALLAALVLVSLVAASFAARYATGGTPRAARAATESESDRLSRPRVAGGILLVLLGLTMGTLALAIGSGSDDPFVAMQLAGPASIYTSLGLALLGPLWLRIAGRLLGPVLSRCGPAGHLAASHIRRRSVRFGSSLLPVVVFVGIGNGTLYLMSIHHATQNAASRAADPEGVVSLLNYVVVGMIAAFAAIMVINTVVATLADRRRELGRQRLLGATDGDVVAEVVLESVLMLVTSVVVGGLASLVTIIPFAIVKTDSWLPATGPVPFVGVVAAAAVVTVGTAAATVSRLVRRPALESAVAA